MCNLLISIIISVIGNKNIHYIKHLIFYDDEIVSEAKYPSLNLIRVFYYDQSRINNDRIRKYRLR